MSHLAVVIPVFNSERTLRPLYERLCASLQPIVADFEIIFVEDGGADHSWDVILELATHDPRVKGLRFSRNFGQHHGLTAGLDVCDADWVVMMDCDLQDDPDEIPRLYAKALEGYDVVLARRAQRQDPAQKRALSWVFYRLFGFLTGTKWDGRVGVFRILSRTVVGQLAGMREQLRFVAGLIDWMGFPTATVDVQHASRAEGRSQYTMARLVRLGVSAIIAHSDRPLWLAIQVGFVFSAGAFITGAYLVGRFLIVGSSIIGWSSLMVSLCFLGGLIISLLGMVGVYVGRVFDEVKGRPLYIVRTRVNLG